MPVTYLFIIVTPGYLMELGLLRYPYNYMNNRSLQELFPMMIEDQNINTIFNFEVSVSETKLYKKTEGILSTYNRKNWIVSR